MAVWAEIADRGARRLQAGGECYQLIPCLNDNEDWMRAMAGMVEGSVKSSIDKGKMM